MACIMQSHLITMKNRILTVVAVGALLLSGYEMSATAQSSTNTATKPDKNQTENAGKGSDTTTKAPVDPSKSDKPGDATAPKSAGTDNAKTGVETSKPRAADQTQAPSKK